MDSSFWFDTNKAQWLCLVLIQPRKTGKCPDMTEKLMTDVKQELKQTINFGWSFVYIEGSQDMISK